MSSCIVALYLSLLSVPAFVWLVMVASPTAAAGSQASGNEDPDEAYAGREDLANARRALDLWSARLTQTPAHFDTTWKVARARYWLGSHDTESTRRAHFEAGVEAGRQAAAIEKNRPEGHFWQAANMGALAESFGLRQGLKYRKTVREAAERTLAADPAYLGGAADRVLGRWYFKVPGLFGGSNYKSVEHLERALTYKADSTVTRYFLAETLVDMDRKAEARAELQKVLDSPLDPEWAPEDREWKAKARVLLDKIR